jgi:hypothetical protein
MFRRADGRIYGVLNDFDLAVYWNKRREPSKQRTGTKPYMAIDLLDNMHVPHLYRHDLESFFYVIVWIVRRYHDGKEIEDPPLQKWTDLGGRELQNEKFRFLHQEMPDPTPKFTGLVDCIYDMQEAFRRGFNARSEYLLNCQRAKRTGLSIPHFNGETLDDHVSFGVFRRIFGI